METQLASPPSPRRAKVTEGYVDLLAERRETSDLRWAIREWQSRGDYRYGCHMSRKEIFDHVIQSDRVRHTIARVSGDCVLVTQVSSYLFPFSICTFEIFSLSTSSVFIVLLNIFKFFVCVYSFPFQTQPLTLIPSCVF